MPRDPRYESNAERQAAYRARKRTELELESEPTPASSEEMLDLLEPARRTVLISEDDYARKIRREALDYSKSIGETDAPFKVGEETLRNRRSDRLKRAEAYARWRYQGFLAGEIASL